MRSAECLEPDDGPPIAGWAIGPDVFFMPTRSFHRTALILFVALGVAGLAGCQPTGNARCDKLTAQIARADQNGYRLRCDAPFAGQANTGRLVLGWTDHATDTIWIWPERLVDSRALRKVAWHEVGHVVWERRNRSGTQAEEERWADGFAYCTEPIAGVSYSIRPTNCGAYR